MTVTIELLVGDPESFDETIRHLISRNWDDSKTNSITPVFISPHGYANNAADTSKENSANDWKALKNQNFIRFKSQDDLRQDPGRWSNSVRIVITIVNIDIFAITSHLELLFKAEINRILWENQANQTTRILKSNNTESSAIATFDRQFIEFIPVGNFDDKVITRQLAGELGCVWQERKS